MKQHQIPILIQIITTASDSNTDPTIIVTLTLPLDWSFCDICRFVVTSENVVIGVVDGDVEVEIEVSAVDAVLLCSVVYVIISVTLDAVIDSIVTSITAEPVNGRSPPSAAVTL